MERDETSSNSAHARRVSLDPSLSSVRRQRSLPPLRMMHTPHARATAAFRARNHLAMRLARDIAV